MRKKKQNKSSKNVKQMNFLNIINFYLMEVDKVGLICLVYKVKLNSQIYQEKLELLLKVIYL